MNNGAGGEYDAIIIGTGPGGGSVARELSRHGRKLLILEKGSNAPIRGSVGQTISTTLTPGKGLHFSQQFLAIIQGVAVGGSSIPYYACVFDPPYEMFAAYGIDLRSEVEAVKRELPIAPLSDDLLGPAARRIMASAQELGYPWHKIPKLVYQQKCRLDCDKCSMGCPFGAKWTSRLFVEEACRNGAVLLAGATARRVLVDKYRAIGVEYTYGGRQQRAFADTVIVAAGGIGTPQILRRSGIARAGYDFFFDPLLVVWGVIDDLDGGREFPMAAGHHFRDEGFILTDLVSPRWVYWLFAAEVLRFDRLTAHSRIAPVMVKVRDELGGYITDRGGVRKRLGAIEAERMRSGCKIAQEILRNAGARSIFMSRRMATHPGGTAKINDVVDANLQTEIDNLFVCDCSVMPEAWGLPPVLTILALGKRLGKHLTVASPVAAAG